MITLWVVLFINMVDALQDSSALKVLLHLFHAQLVNTILNINKIVVYLVLWENTVMRKDLLRQQLELRHANLAIIALKEQLFLILLTIQQEECAVLVIIAQAVVLSFHAQMDSMNLEVALSSAKNAIKDLYVLKDLFYQHHAPKAFIVQKMPVNLFFVLLALMVILKDSTQILNVPNALQENIVKTALL